MEVAEEEEEVEVVDGKVMEMMEVSNTPESFVTFKTLVTSCRTPAEYYRPFSPPFVDLNTHVILVLNEDSGEWGGDGHTKSSSQMLAPGTLGFWMLIAAASAMAIAIAAMVVGSRRRSKEQYHPLKGALERRMKMFGGLAGGCHEDRELCDAQRSGMSADIMENEMTAMDSKNEYKQMV